MFKLLKGGECYTPENIGKKDILIVDNKIFKIEDKIDIDLPWQLEVADCTGKIVCPAFIDQHVHITGGGGEEGQVSRVPEVMLKDIIQAGVGTLVGLLGVDNITRSLAGLLSKAQALELEGISTYMYTGCYAVPTATLTGKCISDITFVDKVIGIGEIAISDYRSTHPTTQMLKELSWEARVGGLIANKAGVVHIHVGDGKEGLSPLKQLLDESNFTMDMFVPTHLNRNSNLFKQAQEYAKMGGNIDLTAGQKTGIGISVPDALSELLAGGVDIQRVTVSSDGNGSVPGENGGPTTVGKMKQLFDDIRSCCLDKKIPLDVVLRTVTTNVAKLLKLYPKKGTVAVGSDADILVMNKEDLSIYYMLLGGNFFIKNGIITKKGRYET